VGRGCLQRFGEDSEAFFRLIGVPRFLRLPSAYHKSKLLITAICAVSRFLKKGYDIIQYYPIIFLRRMTLE